MITYKLLVADIDGTVVEHGSNGDEVHIKHPSKVAMKEAEKTGSVITFATGRNFEWAKPVIKAFEVHKPVIVNNGSQIIDPVSGRVIWEKRLDLDKSKEICKFIKDNDLQEDLQIGFGYLEEIYFSDTNIDEFEDLIYLDLIGFSNQEVVDSVINYALSLGAIASQVPSPQCPGRWNIIITNSQASKYYALIELQKILKVDINETIAIGDGNNDLPLFRASGLRVAVGNAQEKLKEAADIIVSSFDEHGIVEVIEKYLLANESSNSSV